MKNKHKQQIIFSTCLILFIPSLIAWLINLEIALQAIGINLSFISNWLPDTLYTIFRPLAADLSTISTLVPVLLFGFPLFMLTHIKRKEKKEPGYIFHIIYDPYPPHFPFFLVMLGLTGTLYGLLIGLSASGVSELGASTPSAASIRNTVDRLLDGTATALLSSLFGLIGAFLAARPFPWIFRNALGIEEEESQHNLEESVKTLTRDLQALSHASREFSEHLNINTADNINKHLEQINTTINNLAEQVNITNTALNTLVSLQQKTIEQLAPLNHLNQLEQLNEINAKTQSISDNLAKNTDKLNGINEGQSRITSATEKLTNTIERGNESIQQTMKDINNALTINRQETQISRTALQKAIQQYIITLADENEKS